MGGIEVQRPAPDDDPRPDAEVRGASPEPQLPPEESDEEILTALACSERQLAEHVTALSKDLEAVREAIAEQKRESEDLVSAATRGTARGVGIAFANVG